MSKKILWIGDGGVATGFARVNHSIINNLPKDKYEVHHLAINYKGDPYPEATTPLYPAFLGGDIYGINRIDGLVKKIKPDLLFILNDTWVLHQYLKHIPEELKVVVYFPVDAKPLQPEWVEPIVDKTTPVAYTEFGKSAITDLVPDTDVRVIPHGIDTKKFFPMNMKEARSRMAGIEPNDFVVLNANRNQPRKRFDLTLKGFAEFAKDKPKNVKLYCHCGVEDMGWHIIKLSERLNIADRLILTSLELSPISYVDDIRMNWIYNACDIGLNTSMGEGWSLTVFEHGACKRAQIVPDSSAPAELYRDLAYLIPISRYETYPRVLTEGGVVSIEDVAIALEHYYSNSKARKKDTKALYTFITQPKFDWKNIGKRWDKLFMEILNK